MDQPTCKGFKPGWSEEQRAALAVNEAVDHVRPDTYAEQSDDQDPEPVP